MTESDQHISNAEEMVENKNVQDVDGDDKAGHVKLFRNFPITENNRKPQEVRRNSKNH